MPTAVINPSSLQGSVSVPLSKSLLHRGLVCSALAGDLALCALPEGGGLSDDIAASRECLGALLDAQAAGGRALLDCRESGTTLRLLVPVLAALGVEATLSGRGRLPARPLSEYRKALGGHGVELEFPEGGLSLPLGIRGRLRPGVFTLPGNVSSQYISGMLLALPLLDGDSEVRLASPLESEPYVNMTLDVMRHFGVEALRTAAGYSVAGGQRYRAADRYVSEPDFSQAAFWQLAAYLGHKVEVAGLPNRTSQGDSAFAAMLEKLAASAGGKCEIDVSQTPDLVPALAGAAASSNCETLIANAARLRLKESDRVATTCAMLEAFGVEAQEYADSIAIRPRRLPFKAGVVDGANDHRIVMAAAMMATRAGGEVRITGSQATAKSYPGFFDDFRKAGGIANELNVG